MAAWDFEEDKKLLLLCVQFGVQWKVVSEKMDGRTLDSVRLHYQKLRREDSKADLATEKKGEKLGKGSTWTEAEDRRLLLLAIGETTYDWDKICLELPGKTREAARQRFQKLRREVEQHADTEQGTIAGAKKAGRKRKREDDESSDTDTLKKKKVRRYKQEEVVGVLDQSGGAAEVKAEQTDEGYDEGSSPSSLSSTQPRTPGPRESDSVRSGDHGVVAREESPMFSGDPPTPGWRSDE